MDLCINQRCLRYFHLNLGQLLPCLISAFTKWRDIELCNKPCTFLVNMTIFKLYNNNSTLDKLVIMTRSIQLYSSTPASARGVFYSNIQHALLIQHCLLVILVCKSKIKTHNVLIINETNPFIYIFFNFHINFILKHTVIPC